jgi:hypothetical protein
LDAEIRDLVHKSLTGMSSTDERSLTYEEKLCFMDLVANLVGSWLIGWLVVWLVGWLVSWLFGWLVV